jgi:hypothetical protein
VRTIAEPHPIRTMILLGGRSCAEARPLAHDPRDEARFRVFLGDDRVVGFPLLGTSEITSGWPDGQSLEIGIDAPGCGFQAQRRARLMQ